MYQFIDKPVPSHRYALFLALAAGGCALDLLTKKWMFDWLGMPGESRGYWMKENVFGFQTSLNEGALFGLGQGGGTLFIVLSLFAVLAILYWLFYRRAAHDLLITISLGCVLGGTLGNLYDRMGMSGLVWNYANDLHSIGTPVYAVRDWIYFKLIEWPIFNIADSLLVCGAALLVWHAYWYREPEVSGKRVPV